MPRKPAAQLPSAIPSPQAAPVSTYYDPRLPLPQADPTAGELQKFADSLSKWGLLQWKDDKEEAKAAAIKSAWDISDSDLRELVEADLAPDTPDVYGPDPAPAAITAEAAAKEAEDRARHKELRANFLDMRSKGLAKNADPFYRKWRSQILASRLARQYGSDVEIRLKEAYELDPDTGEPALDYSDLAQEIYGKYEGLVSQLGIHGEEAFAPLKGVKDSELADRAIREINAREDDQATRETAVAATTMMVELALGPVAGVTDDFGQVDYADPEQLKKIAEFYKAAWDNVDDLREAIPAHIKAAAHILLQKERDKELPEGEGERMALEMLETLLPSGDEDGKGLILGTSIKYDEIVQAQISDLKSEIEATAEKNNETRDKRKRKRIYDQAAAIMLEVQAAGGTEDEALKAATDALAQDGLDPNDAIVVAQLERLSAVFTDAKDAGKWEPTKAADMKFEYHSMLIAGASESEIIEWMVSTGALRGDPDFYGPILRNMKSASFSAQAQKHPQIVDARAAALAQISPDYGPKYMKDMGVLRTQLTQLMSEADTAVEAVKIANVYGTKFEEATTAERNRVRGIEEKFQRHLDKFEPEDARALLKQEQGTLTRRTETQLNERLGRFKPEELWRTALLGDIANKVKVHKGRNALFVAASDKNSVFNDDDAFIQANKDAGSIEASLQERAHDMWKKLRGTMPPAELINRITNELEPVAEERFSTWYQSASTTTGTDTETLRTVVMKGVTPALLEDQQGSTPHGAVSDPNIAEALQISERAGKMTYSPRRILQRQTEFAMDPNSLGSLAFERARDMRDLRIFLVDRQALAGLSSDQRDSLVIAVARTRNISIGNLVSGTMTITGRGDAAPWKRGIQSDHQVNISPEHLKAIGLSSFSPKSNLFVHSEEDSILLNILATGEDSQGAAVTEVSVDGVAVPLEEAQRRLLGAFGISEKSVANKLEAGDLGDWIKDIAEQQVALSINWAVSGPMTPGERNKLGKSWALVPGTKFQESMKKPEKPKVELVGPTLDSFRKFSKSLGETLVTAPTTKDLGAFLQFAQKQDQAWAKSGFATPEFIWERIERDDALTAQFIKYLGRSQENN